MADVVEEIASALAVLGGLAGIASVVNYMVLVRRRKALERRFAEQMRQRGGKMMILPPSSTFLAPPTSRGGASRPGHFSSSRPFVELPKVSGRPGAGAETQWPVGKALAEAERRSAARRAFGMVTAAEATENLMRLLGVPEPLPRPFELFGECPNCRTVDTHLLGDRDTTTVTTASGTVGPSIGRECRTCGHMWRERLAPLTPGTDTGSEN